jgi:hypothetical protein
MGVLASGKKDDLSSARTAVPGNPEVIRSARDDMKTYALATDVFLAAAIVTATTGIILFAIDESDAPEEDADRDASAVKVGLLPNGVFAGGRF